MKRRYPKEYRAWANMHQRCRSRNRKDWKNYGGRGIRVCPEWSDFSNFIADMGRRPDGYSLDRKDNNGDYTPSNCRWVDRVTQNRNRRMCVPVTINGETRIIAEWAEVSGISHKKIEDRIRAGHSGSRLIENQDLRRLFSGRGRKRQLEGSVQTV